MSKTYGEDMPIKKDNEYRIISNNIGCIGIDAIVNHKQTSLKDWLVEHEVDIAGWQEIGLAQHMFPKHERLAERMRDFRRKQIRVSSSNNRHESIERFQWGGTAVLAFDMLANMTRSTGADETGLGRWSWLQLEGHNNRKVRVISAYNSCRTKTTQFGTVYSQQKRYLLSQLKDVCPRMQFRKDLCHIIKQWQNNGEAVILLIDWNENLAMMKDLQRHLTVTLGLIDPIRDKYGVTDTLPPTKNTGSYPIDSIFVTQDLNNICRGGWLEFGNGHSDHRILYMDIDLFTLLGRHKNSATTLKIRRLQCTDPRTVDAYNKKLAEQYDHHNMHNKIADFEKKVSIPPTKDDIQRLIKLDRINTQLVLHAEKKCRKLYMGAKPFTPEVNHLGAVINAWHVLIHKKEGKCVGSRWFKRCLKLIGVRNFSQLSIEDCIEQRAIAFKTYNSYGCQIEEKRYEWIDDLADAIAAKGNISKSAAVRQLKSREESSHTYRQIRVATKNILGAPYHMELTKNGESFVSTDKEEIESALIDEYENKYHLAEASPFLREPLLSDIGALALGDSASQILNGTYSCPSGVNKYTEKFISYLKKDDIVTKYKKVSSSPSDRHYGTYKAACLHEGNAKVQAKMTSWPYQLGYPLPRTKNCINVSLLKKGKGITPSDLRTIWLLEADFNAGAKQHL